MKRIKIGTRGSKLAIAQSMWVKEQIESRYKDIEVELVKIKTKGDKILNSPLSKIGGKGLFVKEIENALLRGEIDIAVHSIKDVPFDLPEGLEIPIYPKREDPLDAFISRSFKSIEEVPERAKIGTSSLRREVQIKRLKKGIKIVPIRGNVDTRLKKMETEKLDGIILAVAGLKRLGLYHKITQILPEELMLPAIGQGALGIETRIDDFETKALLSFLNHTETEICVKAERSFLKELGGGCQIPIAAKASIRGNKLQIKGMVSDLKAERFLKEILIGDVSEPEDLGKRLAEKLLKKGAEQILEEVYHG